MLKVSNLLIMSIQQIFRHQLNQCKQKGRVGLLFTKIELSYKADPLLLDLFLYILELFFGCCD